MQATSLSEPTGVRGLATANFSLTRGGPFYRLLCFLEVVRSGPRDMVRTAVVCCAFTWLPAALFDTAQQTTGHGSFRPMQEWSAHVRLLVALPLLVFGEAALDRLCTRALQMFETGRYATFADSGALEPVLHRAEQLRDSAGVETLLVVLSFGLQVGNWLQTGHVGFLGTEYMGRISPALAWYAFVAIPFCNFVLYRALWRWLIWAKLLWQLSRLRLSLVPTHPDRAAGLEHLAQPTLGFALTLAAVSCTVAAAWVDRIVQSGVSAGSLVVHLTVLVLSGQLLAFAPLLPFTGQLVRARLTGQHEYGLFARRYVQRFHTKWVNRGMRDELLGTSDIQSLADLANSYAVVDRMRPFAFSVRQALVCLLALLGPMLSLVVAERTAQELVLGAAQALLGTLGP